MAFLIALLIVAPIGLIVLAAMIRDNPAPPIEPQDKGGKR